MRSRTRRNADRWSAVSSTASRRMLRRPAACDTADQRSALQTASTFLQHLAKLCKQRRRVMRARRRFGVILHAEDRLRLVMHAFYGLIIQIDPIHRDVGRK